MPLYDVPFAAAAVYVLLCAVVFTLWFRFRGTAYHQSIVDSLRVERIVSVLAGLGFLVYAVVTGSTMAFIGGLVFLVVALGDDYVYRIWK